MSDSAYAESVYRWLVAQQMPTGILGNQEDEYFSGLYTNALAALCYMHQGDLVRAENVLSFFDGHLESVAKAPLGGFTQFWDAATGEPHLDSDRWVGDNAWLLIALNHHYRITKEDRYAEMRRTIAQWLISLQDADGGIKSGFNQDGLMFWKSTEANLDCYAALTEYPEQRQRIKTFLRDQMWVAHEGRFRMGSTVSESALDTCSWGVAALGIDYAAALQYAEDTFLCTYTSDATGANITGFSDFVSRERIWLEGTGEMVVAYQVAGQHDKAQFYLQELDKAMMPSSRFGRLVGLPCHTNAPAWPTGSTQIFVPSQAWYLFGCWQFNPMDSSFCGCPQSADFNADGIVNGADLAKLAGSWLLYEASSDIAPSPAGDAIVDAHDLMSLAECWLMRIDYAVER